MLYKVSVVTPFHNVDMRMFQQAADSMRAQTIGFENVEWVVVVHNCEPQYLPRLQAMFSGDKNVIVKELNNEATTPLVAPQLWYAVYHGTLSGIPRRR